MKTIKIKEFSFSKYHGLGNDYIIINDLISVVPEEKKGILAKKLCERRYSVGADGLIFVSNSEKYDIKMRIFNNDGSEAEMCGNGMRCFSKYVFENNLVDKISFKVETLNGLIIPELVVENGKVIEVKVNMGIPILECDKIPVIPGKDPMHCINEKIQAGDKNYNFTAVSMGNPHAVVFKEVDLNNQEVEKYGSIIESHERFPNKTNVEFVKIISNQEAQIKVYERGVGITMACGTGACASVVAGTILDKFKTNKPVTIHTDGGDLIITASDDGVYMEGPVVKVYDAKIENFEI